MQSSKHGLGMQNHWSFDNGRYFNISKIFPKFNSRQIKISDSKYLEKTPTQSVAWFWKNASKNSLFPVFIHTESKITYIVRYTQDDEEEDLGDEQAYICGKYLRSIRNIELIVMERLLRARLEKISLTSGACFVMLLCALLNGIYTVKWFDFCRNWIKKFQQCFTLFTVQVVGQLPGQ